MEEDRWDGSISNDVQDGGEVSGQGGGELLLLDAGNELNEDVKGVGLEAGVLASVEGFDVPQ